MLTQIKEQIKRFETETVDIWPNHKEGDRESYYQNAPKEFMKAKELLEKILLTHQEILYIIFWFYEDQKLIQTNETKYAMTTIVEKLMGEDKTIKFLDLYEEATRSGQKRLWPFAGEEATENFDKEAKGKSLEL